MSESSAEGKIKKLLEKTALVTGAASPKGLGFATARLFAAEGARVILTDIDTDAVRLRAEELCAQGLSVLWHAHDVTDAASWSDVFDYMLSQFGRLDIVVNNAAVVKSSSLVEASLEHWNLVIATNLTSVFLGCQMAARRMRAQGEGGSIINISSIAGLKGFQNLIAYTASKGGVTLLTKSAALDVAQWNIRINSVHPGHIDTDVLDFTRAKAPEVVASLIAGIPMKRLGDAGAVADMVLFLASDESRYVTGAEFVVDGGLTAK